MNTPVYLEQSNTNLACWYIRHCDTQEVLHVEPSGRGWALEACKDLDYQVKYEVWPHPMPANQMNPLLQAQIDAGELIVRYKNQHVCWVCKRTDEANEHFLGFHAAWDREAEICDTCAARLGCGCCNTQTFITVRGAAPDYELADHEREIDHHGEWY